MTTNTPKLKDGTELKVGMFIDNGISAYYVLMINDINERMFLKEIGFLDRDDGWMYGVEDLTYKTLRASKAYKSHVIPSAQLHDFIDSLNGECSLLGEMLVAATQELERNMKRGKDLSATEKLQKQNKRLIELTNTEKGRNDVLKHWLHRWQGIHDSKEK
jgi:hypothetical protein